MRRSLRILSIAGGVLVAFVLLLMVIGRLNPAPEDHTTFRVLVPESTPTDDTIALTFEFAVFPMTKTGEHLYEVTIDVSPWHEGSGIRYGYTRGGFQPYGELGYNGNTGPRNFFPGEEKVREEQVFEWRWLPNGAYPALDFDSAAASTPVAPRERFWAGPLMVDFWNPYWPLQYNATLTQLERVGYEWVGLAPPWDYASMDPPVIDDDNVPVPAWSETELRDEIRMFKDAGLNVLLAPQVCCERPGFENRTESWWRAWYDEYEDFVRFHTAIAQEEGVDALIFNGPPESYPGNALAPSFARERWDAAFAVARTAGVPLGLSMITGVQDGVTPQLPWPPESRAFFGDVDFLSIGIWDGLSDKQDPSGEEIDAAFDRVFFGLDHAHNISNKPIVFGQIAYFSEVDGAKPKGPETYPTWGNVEANRTRFDPRLQARIYESLMRHVAPRSHIEGAFPFGYTYLDAPLTLDSDIRAKPAEDVFVGWMERLRSTQAT